MNQLSLDELMEKVDSRYTLVVVAAKRARALTEKGADREDGTFSKPVTAALKEILRDKISYTRTDRNVK